VRALAFSVVLLLALSARGQGLVINEVQSACRTTLRTAEGDTPDWIELYNPSRRAISLQGMRITSADRTHVFEHDLRIPARGHLLLQADERLSNGPEHLGFRLDRDGGTLLLIDRDGTTILDVFIHPALGTDRSMGRSPDGAGGWSYFATPTPGRSNTTPEGGPVRAIAGPPELAVERDEQDGTLTLRLSAPEPCTIRYTLDGSSPAGSDARTVEGAIRSNETVTLRALCRCPKALDGPELVRTIHLANGASTGIALTLAPEDLWDNDRGIYVEGNGGNYSKGGIAQERPGYVEGPSGGAVPVGVRISGSGSRGRPKRSFKLYARDRYGSPDSAWTLPDGTRCDEVMVRADATPHATLHNLLMEAMVQRSGLQVEVQSSRLMPLYLNGRFWGHYRMMPPKDAQWLRQRAGEEAVDVVDGPAHAALSGSNAHFLKARHHLLSAAPRDSVASLLDLNSTFDLATLDLYMGRADHDLNVRAYRPRRSGGRWRWVLFDMDLWADVKDLTVDRMSSSGQPEVPFVPQLLSHPELQPAFLARLTAVNATALHPVRAADLLDSLYRTHGPALREDRDRWAGEMEVPDPAATVAQLEDFVERRGGLLLEQLSEHTGRALGRVRIDVPPIHQGQVLLDGLVLAPGKQDIRCFSGIPARITVLPAPGHEGQVLGKVLQDGVLDLKDLSRSGPLRIRFLATAP
jgi:hypothetical protein